MAELAEPPSISVQPVVEAPDPVPIAAIVCAVAVLYLAGLIAFFVILKLLSKRCGWSYQGGRCPSCCSARPCTECFLRLAECTDCRVPSLDACLDTVCPSKQRCALLCGGCRQWWRLHCGWPDCPAPCSSCHAPTLHCWSCQCHLQMPDLHNVTFLCIKCGDSEDQERV